MATEPRCDPAQAFVRLVSEAILSKFNPNQRVSPEKVAAAQDLLETFYKKQLATLELTHYPAAYGSHWCVSDAFEQLSFRISALGLAPPEKEQAPAPSEESLTPESVIRHLETRIRASQREMYVGTEEQSPNTVTPSAAEDSR
jgi:hypothetical protein